MLHPGDVFSKKQKIKKPRRKPFNRQLGTLRNYALLRFLPIGDIFT